MRRLLASAMILGLAACAGTPKKTEPAPAGATAGAPARGAAAPGRRVSPYAPAQEDPSTRGHYTAGGLYRPGVADSTPDHVPDVDAIPEPDVVDEPRSAVGNRPTYTVLGKRYHVLDDPRGYVERGTASYYGQKFHGRRTSNLEVYDMYAFTAAHKTLPLPSFARVTNLDNGKSVVVRVNDRGPFHDGRVIDLSYAAAVKLGIVQRGTGNVEVRALAPGDDDRPMLASAPPPAAPEPSPLDTLVASIPEGTPASTGTPVATLAVADTTASRFQMHADGRTMSADEFDAWMKSRQVRVATGRPAGTVAAVPPATAVAAPADVVAAPPVDGVVLQVASFSARANADRALGMLREAGIGQAQVLDGQSNGRPVWRLRVGPLPEAAAPELAARIAGLGFGQPQAVRD